MKTKYLKKHLPPISTDVNYSKITGFIFSISGLLGLLLTKIFPVMTYAAFLITGIIYLAITYIPGLHSKNNPKTTILKIIAVIMVFIGVVIAFLYQK